MACTENNVDRCIKNNTGEFTSMHGLHNYSSTHTASAGFVKPTWKQRAIALNDKNTYTHTYTHTPARTDNQPTVPDESVIACLLVTLYPRVQISHDQNWLLTRYTVIITDRRPAYHHRYIRLLTVLLLHLVVYATLNGSCRVRTQVCRTLVFQDKITSFSRLLEKFSRHFFMFMAWSDSVERPKVLWTEKTSTCSSQ